MGNMPNFNSIQLMGHVTRDPELRSTQSGTGVCSFGLAINRKWTKDGETHESVCFIDCTAWGKTGELVSQFVKKGDPLFVAGRLDFQQWEDKNGGGKRSKHTVTVDTVQFIKTPTASAVRSAPKDDEAPF